LGGRRFFGSIAPLNSTIWFPVGAFLLRYHQVEDSYVCAQVDWSFLHGGYLTQGDDHNKNSFPSSPFARRGWGQLTSIRGSVLFFFLACVFQCFFLMAEVFQEPLPIRIFILFSFCFPVGRSGGTKTGRGWTVDSVSKPFESAHGSRLVGDVVPFLLAPFPSLFFCGRREWDPSRRLDLPSRFMFFGFVSSVIFVQFYSSCFFPGLPGKFLVSPVRSCLAVGGR